HTRSRPTDGRPRLRDPQGAPRRRRHHAARRAERSAHRRDRGSHLRHALGREDRVPRHRRGARAPRRLRDRLHRDEQLTMLLATVSNIAQYATDSIYYGSFFALISLSLSLLFGVMGLMNFAYGELIMSGAYVMFYTRSWGWLPMIVMTIIV